MPSGRSSPTRGAGPPTSSTTRRPRAACPATRARRSSPTATPARPSTSGPPSTRVPRSARVTPLHLRADEKGTSARTSPAAPGTASAIAAMVALRAPALAASAPRSARRAASSRPSTASSPPTRMRFSVSVPVLSRQRVSTEARLSTAFRRCASVPRRASRTAATAKVRLVSSTSPSGTSGTRPATTVAALSSTPAPRIISDAIRSTASGTIAATVIRRMRLMSVWSGLSGEPVPRASAARRSAKLSAPTASTR